MTTTHAFDREEVMAYVDGELADQKMAIVRAHLDECADCRRLVDELRDVSSRLSMWTVEASPAHLRPPTISLTPTVNAPRRPRWLWARGRAGLPRWAFAAAPALIVLGLMAVWSRASKSPASPAAGFAMTAPQGVSAVPTRELQRGGGLAGSRQAMAALAIETQTDLPMVIRTARLVLGTDRFDDIRPALERVVAVHEGRIASLNVSADEPTRRVLNATLRVPSTKLDGALSSLRQLGRVRDESLDTQEVTDSYRDLTVRIANSKREEQRLVELLSRRTGDLKDVLAVEQAIARVRGEVERMDAEERAMKGRVDLATVTVEVRENYRAEIALGPLPIGTRLRNAVVDGARGAAESVVEAALVLLGVAPGLLVWALILAWPIRWMWRRYQALAKAG